MLLISRNAVIFLYYSTVVVRHLEYCFQFWALHFMRDVEQMDRVERRVTNMY